MTKLTHQGIGVVLDAIDNDYRTSDYYMFTSKYTEWPNGDVVPTAANTSVVFQQQARDEMLMLKKIQDTGVRFMTRRIDWAANTVYDEYDDVVDLESKDFYVFTSSREVYKCLDNGGGVASTVMPSLTTNTSFTTADGYKWKYMYTVDEEIMDLHATSNTIPIELSSAVQDSAVPGAIESVRVVSSANAWPSHETVTVALAVSNTTFKVDTLQEVESDYYVNFAAYVTSGGGAGFLSRITNYVANGSGQFITTETGNTLVGSGSTVPVPPRAVISRRGRGERANAGVNGTGEIDKINVISVGSGYTWANAVVSCNSMHQSTATLRVVTSPPGGHGSDPKTELYADTIQFTAKFSYLDGLLVPYRITGVAKDVLSVDGQPLGESVTVAYNTANVTILPGVSYPPTVGETIRGYTSGATATVITSSNTNITFGDVTGTFSVGETVLGTQSSSLVSLDAINTSTVDRNSGTIVFIDKMNPVQRQTNTSETVYVEIKL